uniref:Adhesion G protein-coupled receptor A3 n=1 Tax=Erpetoichthys calabaricus TaxID=27687 RepID=A0A8C4X499_ERPCA
EIYLCILLLEKCCLGIPSGCKSFEERPKASGKTALSSSSSPTLEKKVVCSNMDMVQLIPPEKLPNRTVTLYLQNNQINSIEPGAFLGLLALKRLFKYTLKAFFHLFKIREFQTQYLLCDCKLLWLMFWIKERNITVRESRCAYPRSLQGQLVTIVKPELLTCDAPLELPSFQMTPSNHQIVFEGDSLPFQCMASYIDQDMQVLWYQDGKVVEPNASQGIYIEKTKVENCSLIASALTISNIQTGSNGKWECRVRTRRGNNTRTVRIVVLESTAQYCPPERVINNKGDFRWPRTLAGITAYQLCTRYSAGSGIYPGLSSDERKAWRRCDRGGFWAEEDYSRCQYANDATRVLYIINQMPLNLTNAVTTARQLLAYTVEAANFSDKMDVIFVAQMIEKFAWFAEKYKELGDVMVDIASNVMLADERVLWMAQREAKACTRIVQCLQKIASYRLSSGAQVYSTYSPNIALEAYVIKASSFSGMTCTVFQKLTIDRTILGEFGRRDPDMNLDKQLSFKCNVTHTLSSIALKNTIVEASIQLPSNLFSQQSISGQSDDAIYKLQLIAFRNGKLFPATGNTSFLADDGKRRTVATPVILTKLDGFIVKDLRSPINVTLRRIAHGVDAVAAMWNFSLLGGQGGWASEGCIILYSDDNITTIQCNSLSNYAVLMIFFFIPGEVFIFRNRSELLYGLIRISRKSWHMLVNLCFHIFLTCAVFIGGISQTKNASFCQAVGIILHYSTLATILWVGVTARNIYKQVTRKAKHCEDLDEPPPPPRPMLRFYLIGGGIPVIVCGITAAANIKNYGSRANAPYCWMAREPSLGAFYGPAGFIIFVNCMYFLSIFIQLKRHPEKKYELKEMAEEQQRLAANENGETNLNDSISVSHGNYSVVSASALENEHTFHAQLFGASMTLLMFVSLWTFGALSVSMDYPLDLIFSCLFGVVALGLGGFLILHHCVNRDDVRRYWTSACCPGRSSYSVQVNVQPGDSSASNRDAPKCTNSSAESSCTNKSVSSIKNSSHGCKLTNLQAEAAQCKTNPTATNTATQLDNSLTEHSIDNDIKMHVAPLEVQFRPNGHPSRHHKNRTRAHRASRLTVLREYAYDVPTSVEGSVQNGLAKSRHSTYDSHTRSRRAAYLAYRERHYNQCHQDSSDASTTLPKYNKCIDKGGGGGGTSSNSKDSLKQPSMVELDSQSKSYGLNLASQNGPLKESGQEAPLINTDNGNIKTGLWKHETTV